MKSLTLSLAALALSATAALADPIEGLWQTAPDDNGNYGLIQIAPCGSGYCGTLVRSFDGSGSEIPSEHNGRQIITEAVNNGGGEYRGSIYAPDRDRTYNSRLNLSGNSLAVSGCVLGICRDGGTWRRVN